MNDYTIIRCPVCKGELKVSEELHCISCNVSYPIQDGIPIMVPDLKSVDTEQDLAVEKDFYEDMFSDIKGYEDGHCIVYGQEKIYEFMERYDRGTILEAGCGGGQHSINLTKRGFNVTSVDISMNGLRAAKGLAEHKGQEVLFINGDIKRLPFADKQFDICFCSLILHHFMGLDNIVSELCRVTSKVFVAYEVNAYDLLSYLRFNILNPVIGVKNIVQNQRALFPPALSKVLEQNGFQDIDIMYDDVHDYFGKAPDSAKAKLVLTYQRLMKMFPEKYSKNKFLLSAKQL